MSSQSVPVSIQIMDKEYMVSCPPEEREALLESARMLDRRMKEARDGGKVLGTERMAVMAALNIVHELLQNRGERLRFEESMSAEIRRLGEKVGHALGRRNGTETLD